MTKVELDNGQLVYTKHGGGYKILLAFHGFGQDKNVFKEWVKILEKEFTIYAFDLFYHGESSREYGKLSKKEWCQYLKKFLDKESINKFSVLGFSLGGRFAIASSLAYPKNIDQLILIAPDGVFLTIWFKLATNSTIKWLFKYFMLNPDKLDKLLAFNRKYKLVNTYIEDFVKKEMGSPENRKRVYISWNHFKSLGYSRKILSREFNKHGFKRRIILGSKDHVIRPKDILPIIEDMGNFKIDILPMKHHQLIKSEVASLIMVT